MTNSLVVKDEEFYTQLMKELNGTDGKIAFMRFMNDISDLSFANAPNMHDVYESCEKFLKCLDSFDEIHRLTFLVFSKNPKSIKKMAKTTKVGYTEIKSRIEFMTGVFEERCSESITSLVNFALYHRLLRA